MHTQTSCLHSNELHMHLLSIMHACFIHIHTYRPQKDHYGCFLVSPENPPHMVDVHLRYRGCCAYIIP